MSTGSSRGIESLREQIPAIRAISPLAAKKIAYELDCFGDFYSAKKLSAFSDLLLRSGDSARSSRGGGQAKARAWMLVELYVGGFLTRDDPPNKAEAGELLKRVGRLTEAQLEQDIRGHFQLGRSLEKFAELQRHHSRVPWKSGAGTAFTDPAAHDPMRFRYLVTAMRFEVTSVVFPKDQAAKLEYYLSNESYRPYTKQSATGIEILPARRFLERPDTLSSMVLCCSVIDQDHTRTYAGAVFGLILKCPHELIVTASPTDASSAGWINKAMGADLALAQSPVDRLLQVHDFLEVVIDRYSNPLLSPSELLMRTDSGHNEVAVLGSNGSNRRLDLAGIFVKTTKDLKMLKPFLAGCQAGDMEAVIKKCARMNSIKIVPIPDASAKDEGSDVDFRAWLAHVPPIRRPGRPAIRPEDLS